MGTNSKKLKPETEPTEFRIVMTALKKILRERGMTYSDLGKKLNLSTSGTKKIFAGSDCSFQRLAQISKALGFKIADILDQVENEQMTSVQFSDLQQQYFLKNRDAFHFFVKLVVERAPLKLIQKEFQLSDSQVFKYLKKLDDLGFLKLHPQNAIKLPPLSRVKNFGSGPLLSEVYHEWSQSLANELAHPKNQSTGQFIIRCFSMKNDTYEDLLSRLLELEKEFLKRAVREMSVTNTGLKPVRFVWLTDQSSFIQRSLK